GPDLLDPGLEAQQLAVAGRAPEAAPSLHNGQAEAFPEVLEGLFGLEAAGPQIVLDSPMAVAEIADEIDDAVGIGVPKAYPHRGAVHSIPEIILVRLGHVSSP